MLKMITVMRAIIRFQTSSDDYTAQVYTPEGICRGIENDELLPTDRKGLYTLSVSDVRLRELSIKIVDESIPPRSTPAIVEKTQKETVMLSYFVEE